MCNTRTRGYGPDRVSILRVRVGPYNATGTGTTGIPFTRPFWAILGHPLLLNTAGKSQSVYAKCSVLAWQSLIYILSTIIDLLVRSTIRHFNLNSVHGRSNSFYLIIVYTLRLFAHGEQEKEPVPIFSHEVIFIWARCIFAFDGNIFQTGNNDIFQNLIWRPLPSWIFK